MFNFKRITDTLYNTVITVEHTVTIHDLAVLFVSVHCTRDDIIDLARKLTHDDIYDIALTELKHAGCERAGFNVGSLNMDKQVEAVEIIFFLRFSNHENAKKGNIGGGTDLV